MRHVAAQWQGKFSARLIARQKVEAQAATLWQENQQLHETLTEWQQWGANAQAVIQSLTAETESLRPLTVWAGHPCMVCKKPMSGVVARESAARALENFGHPSCLENQGPELGGLLLLGGALVGLSQLGKK